MKILSGTSQDGKSLTSSKIARRKREIWRTEILCITTQIKGDLIGSYIASLVEDMILMECVVLAFALSIYSSSRSFMAFLASNQMFQRLACSIHILYSCNRWCSCIAFTVVVDVVYFTQHHFRGFPPLFANHPVPLSRLSYTSENPACSPKPEILRILIFCVFIDSWLTWCMGSQRAASDFLSSGTACVLHMGWRGGWWEASRVAAEKLQPDRPAFSHVVCLSRVNITQAREKSVQSIFSI